MNRLIKAQIKADEERLERNTCDVVDRVFGLPLRPRREQFFNITQEEVAEFDKYCFNKRIPIKSEKGRIWTDDVEGFTRDE